MSASTKSKYALPYCAPPEYPKSVFKVRPKAPVISYVEEVSLLKAPPLTSAHCCGTP